MFLARLIKRLTRSRLQPQVGRLHAAVLRRTRGWIRRSWVLAGGQPVLALTTTGRRSGRSRSTTVAYVEHEEGWAVAPLNLGSDRDPAWCLNLRAHPHATVLVAGSAQPVRVREASGAEAEELWRRFEAQFGQIKNTRRVTRRDVRPIVLEPAHEAERLREHDEKAPDPGRPPHHAGRS